MSEQPIVWKRLFKEEGFGWSFRMRGGNARKFFSTTADGKRILEHKRSVMADNPSRYLGTGDGAEHLIDQLTALLLSWELLPDHLNKEHNLRSVSEHVEPDILLVDAESLNFVAGCVCMPSSWSLNHALGKPVHAVHESVPRLNPNIGHHIDRFLRNMPTGKSFCRENWSITLSNDLDYHPELKRPKPQPDTPPEDLYLRLEHQLFTSIQGGILMGIRIEAVSFQEIRDDSLTWANLAKTLRTMPDEVAAYKGMLNYRNSLAERM